MNSILSCVASLFWVVFDAVVWLELWAHERLLRTSRPHFGVPLSDKPTHAFCSRGVLAREVLKRFLVMDHRTRNKVIADYGIPLFGGLHPKNVFNFRYEFFLENVSSDDVVLDVACGNGLLLSRLSSSIRQGVGIELSETQLALCRAQHAASNLSFHQADIFRYDYSELQRSSPITVALFSHILEHVEDVPALLRLVSAPRVLICVPSQENWLTQLKIHYGLPYHTDATHFREYTRDMLAAELERAGYHVAYIGFNSEGEIVCKANKYS